MAFYLVLVLSAAVLVLIIVYRVILDMRLGDSIEFHRQSVNVELIMGNDGLGHRHCSSITSTSTAASG